MALFLLLVAVGVALVQWQARARETAAMAAYPPTGQFINVDGTNIHARIEGTGPDLVLIHGASGSLRDSTLDLMGRLSANYRVIAFDRPGHGWSERAPGYGGAWNANAESPKAQAQLLQQAADQVGVTNPIVVGHSYGGAVALAWGLERPDDTGALVLLASVSNPWPGKLDLLYRVNSKPLGGALVVPLITAFVPMSLVQRTLATIFVPQDVPPRYMEHFGPSMTLRRSAMRANAQQVNSLRPHIVEMSPKYETLPMPVEILHGTKDTIVPLVIHSEPLSGQIPRAVLTRMEGVGHMPQHADPQAVVDAIARAAVRAGLR